MLIKAKLKPKDDEGATWTLVNFKVAPDVTAAAITQLNFKFILIRAAEHYNCKGVKNRIDVENILIAIISYKDNLEISSLINAALETIMAGRSWPGMMIFNIDSTVDFRCRRCGAQHEDDAFVYWQCPQYL